VITRFPEFKIQFKKDDEYAWKTKTVVPEGIVDLCSFFKGLLGLTLGSQESFESSDGNTVHSNDITLPSDRVDRVQLIIDPSYYFNDYVNNASMSHRNYLKACILS
jgi:hypothetical protein